MFERFTDRARKALANANQLSKKKGYLTLEPECVLIELLRETGLARNILYKIGADPDQIVVATLETILDMRDVVFGAGKLPLSDVTNAVIMAAIEEARTLGHNYVGTEHLLLALASVEGSKAHGVINRFTTAEKLRAARVEIDKDPLGPSNNFRTTETLDLDTVRQIAGLVLEWTQLKKNHVQVMQEIRDLVIDRGAP